ncbi:MAG: autoinducer synthase, partial [Novosphingobium sp. 12-63-9]
MVVTGNGIEQALGDRVFRSMFEERKRVFVDLLGWDIPILAGRYEIDQFDDDEAVYIVITDDSG